VALSWILTFGGAIALLALGIRSYIRVATKARALGELDPGPADTGANAARVYGRALKRWSSDSTLMLVGFGGALAWVIAAPQLLPRLFGP